VLLITYADDIVRPSSTTFTGAAFCRVPAPSATAVVVCHRRSVRRQRFAPMSLFIVAADAYSQQLFLAVESRTAVCLYQFSSKRLFKHFKPRSW